MKDLNIIIQAIDSEDADAPTSGPLLALVDWIRPASKKDHPGINNRLEELIQYLEQNEKEKTVLKYYLSRLLKDYDLHYFFSEYTILKQSGFFGQFRKRFFRKLVPEVPKQKSLAQLVREVFHKKSDSQWLVRINPKLWQQLLQVLDLKSTSFKDSATTKALLQSAKLLSFRIASFGLDDQIQTKYAILNTEVDAFFEQNQLIANIYKETEQKTAYQDIQEDIRTASTVLRDCKEKINILRNQKNKVGTSIELTFLSRQVKYHIDRLLLLLKIYTQRSDDTFGKGILTLLQESVSYQNKKNSLRNLVSEYLDLVTLQIVEHTAQAGEEYIAETKKTYWKFLRASMFGGFVIAIFAMFKIWLYKADMAPFVEAIAYSINYAACFILVKALGGIIATKQPAMTASSIIKDIGGVKKGEEQLVALKNTIIKVSHSQFISFVGNLILAFPMAMLIAYAFEQCTDLTFISEYKAEKLLKDLQPIKGGAIYYAAIAGVFLSLSGLISGYFDNKVIYSNIPARIKNIKWLRSLLGEKGLSSFAKYMEKKLGAFMGNASLGFFLGLAGFVGYITGLPIDIRHIAFSSANFGFVFDPAMATDVILTSLLGIFLIGLFNFIVSFGLTLSIALKARQITFGQTRKLIVLLIKSFFRNPFRFFFPVGAPA